MPRNVFAFTPIAGFEIVLLEGICSDQSERCRGVLCMCALASPVLFVTLLCCVSGSLCCVPMAASREMGYLLSRLMRGDTCPMRLHLLSAPGAPHPSLVIAETQLTHAPARVRMYKYNGNQSGANFPY